MATKIAPRDPVVAVVTCAEVARLHPDDQPLPAALAARGVRAEPVVWDAPDVDWGAYDLALIRSTWDYTRERHRFVAWTRQVPRLVNPAEVVAWNTDKRYLETLQAAGVATVPTVFVDPGDPLRLPESGQFVVKPTVGAGSVDTGRFDAGVTEQEAAAHLLAERILSGGRSIMVQPYLDGVDTRGETGLVFVEGELSHAFCKAALLAPGDTGAEGLYREEEISPRTATPDQVELARAALAAAAAAVGGPGVWPLLYARVDLIPGPDGAPQVLELEFTEPSLFLAMADGALDRFADAVAARARAAQADRYREDRVSGA